MNFDPEIAVKRFGLGLCPRHALPSDLNSLFPLQEPILPVPTLKDVSLDIARFFELRSLRSQGAANQDLIRALNRKRLTKKLDVVRGLAGASLDDPTGIPIRLMLFWVCLLYTSPSPRDGLLSRMPSSA